MITEIIIPIIAVIASCFVAYHVARIATVAEEKKGMALLNAICQRYLISFFNSYDQEKEMVKSDAISKAQHMAELSSLLADLSSLSSNPFYVRLLTSEPSAALCMVQARRELVEHHHADYFAMNSGTAKNFLKLYHKSKNSKHTTTGFGEIVAWIEKTVNAEQGAAANPYPLRS